MAMGNIRWTYVLLWALAVLAALSLGSYCYRAYALERPLEKALTEDVQVLAARVYELKGKTIVAVKLGYVDDLAQTYFRIEQTVQSSLGARDYEIVIEDAPDPVLEEAYRSIHYYIEEAAIRGNFGEMACNAEVALQDARVDDFRLAVASGKIFVQIRREDKYLYRVTQVVAGGGAGS